jgi:hypothetical protein
VSVIERVELDWLKADVPVVPLENGPNAANASAPFTIVSTLPVTAPSVADPVAPPVASSSKTVSAPIRSVSMSTR